ncbi:DUF262 domain-containing protein [Corynebacterium sp. sy039]|uniref:GmrSD restriction endonuclease domain-containing protein n=1 Tax=Corynebacterium sp. sy039 TaxID=2599641 RepID=UPI0011B7AB54|nr:DUF262 domain-containing protein [Corynebacterium sp. sy039]QDZ42422.1 DUF262 domain-containing protein [Corynebacterium sp. sy039]
MAFSTPSYNLIDLFNRIDRGDLQLPDFQRSFRWDVDRIRALLVTVLRGYPMGSFMALDTRNEKPRFKPRALEGAPDTGNAPGLLLLDGQQRLTTLYQCLRGEGMVQSVDFRQKKVQRKYYLDIKKAISSPVLPEEAVISVGADGMVKSHYGPHVTDGLHSREDEIAAGLIPISVLLSDSGTDFLFDLSRDADEHTREEIKKFNNKVIKPLVSYAVPMIRLDRETAQEGIGSIFAQVNSLGLRMDVFELLTAVFQLEDASFSLQEDWAATEKILRKYPALDGIGQTEFLTSVALHATALTGHADGHREAILHLSLAQYKESARIMRSAFNEAANFMAQRCIFTTSHVPYTVQLVPLAVIIALLADTPGVLSKQESWNKLNRWFWCGVFGELYGASSLIERSAADVNEVTQWIKAGVVQEEKQETESQLVPRSVRTARFVESRLLSAGIRSGLYKGIYALIMGRGARDWHSAQVFNQHTFPTMGVHFRPIFPIDWCTEHGISPVLAQSVLNRTPMSRKTHVVVEHSSPSRYLYRLQAKSLLSDAEFDEVLETHLLDPQSLFTDRAEEFFRDRRQRLTEMIEHAMGHPAVRDVDESDLSAGEEGPNAFAS